MDIQSSALNELFALFPIIVQGWVTPVRPVNTADGGIPKSLYDDQPKGLECLVDPWVERFNHAVAVDDRVDLFINNGVTPVDGKTISPSEENLRVRLYVPKGRLRDGVNQIYYRVTRASGNGSEESRKLSVLYHLWVPGEPAPDAIRLLIPDDVVANGVGPELAARGVDFGLEYDNRRPYDFISLTLGSRGLVELELTPEEGDSGQPLVQTLFTNTFKQNPDNPRTPVFYSVTDQLGNFSQSATQYIDVHLNRVMLTPPDLSENPDDPSDDPDTIDLGKVKDVLYVLVHVFSPLWMATDIIRVSYTCTPPVPGTVVTHSAEAMVSRLPFTHKLQVPVAKIIAGSEVSVIYELVRGGKVIGTSKEAEANVISNISYTVNFDTYSLQLLTVGQPIDIPTMQLLLLKGPSVQTGIINLSGAPNIPGQLTGKVLYIHHGYGDSPVPQPRRLRITPRQTIKRVSFMCHNPPRDSTVTIFFYEQNGALLWQEPLKNSTLNNVIFLEFERPGIAKIEIEVGGTCYVCMDYFTFYI